MPLRLSALVLTYNEELNIGACLRSIHEWVDDIHVLDSGSTDATVEIASCYTNNNHVHPYDDHSSQIAWGLDNVPFLHDWLLLLDADNVVTDDLRQEIGTHLPSADPGIAGYYVVHRHVFRGQAIHGLKRNWFRLFRRSLTTVDTGELVDFRLVPAGRTAYMKGAIVEHNLKEDDIDFWIDKHQRFAARMAVEEVLRREKVVRWAWHPRLGGHTDERMTWLKDRWYGMPLYFRPFLYFLYRYFVRGGVRDGTQGLVYHFFQAFWFRLLVDLRRADIQKRLAAGQLSIEDLADQLAPRRPVAANPGRIARGANDQPS